MNEKRMVAACGATMLVLIVAAAWMYYAHVTEQERELERYQKVNAEMIQRTERATAAFNRR